MDLGPVLAGKAHELADDLARQMRADVVDELEFGTEGLGPVEDLPRDGADTSLHLADDARLELGRDRPAVGRVAGWVHRQQHVAHLLE